MRTVNRWIWPIAVAFLFTGTIGVSMTAGWWQSSGKTEVVATTLAPADVKGWMSVGQVADGVGLPFEKVVTMIDPPAGVQVNVDTVLNTLEESVPDFDMTTFRANLAAALDDSTGSPVSPTSSPTPPR